MLELAAEVSAHLGQGDAALERVFALSGPVFRDVEGRQTLRVHIGGQAYFVKRHQGLGWWSILRTLLNFRWPVLSARNERDAVRRVQRAGLATVDVVGYGERGWNPAARQSFLLMRELRDCDSLEQFCARWPAQLPDAQLRHELIEAIATVTRTMHAAGINHRDYYLCHLWLKRAAADDKHSSILSRLHVIDLHRAMWHRRLPDRWRIKDLAGLLFSAWDCGLTKSDCLRFVSSYRERAAREVLASDYRLWNAVIRRAARLYRKTHRRAPPLTLIVPQTDRRERPRTATVPSVLTYPSSVSRAA